MFKGHVKKAYYAICNLNQASASESFVSAVLLYGFDSLGGKHQRNASLKFRNKNPLFLKIDLGALLTAGIILGSTSAVGIFTLHLRTFFCDWADFHVGTCYHSETKKSNLWSYFQ